MKIFRPYWRESLGICIVVFGSPTIFFLRDTLKLGGGSVFSAAFLVLGMALMISPSFLAKMYKPNTTLMKLGLSFLLLSLFYYFFYNPWAENRNYDPVKEFAYLTIIFFFLFLLVNLPNQISETLLMMIALATFVGSVALIVSLFLNPNYVLGQRATVYFGDGEEGGNPHVYAKNGFAQFVSALLILKNKKILIKIFAVFSAFISIVVIIITQTRAILLSLILVIIIFLYFNLTKKQVKETIKSVFTIRNVSIFFVLVFSVYYYLANYTFFFQILTNYTDRFTGTFTNALFTILGNKPESVTNVVEDPSAAQRVLNWTLFKNYWEGQPERLIFGLGFRYGYLDIPVLEAFLDCGILGFILFGGFNFIAAKECYLAMRNKYSDLTTFLAYYYVSFFIGIFSAGRPFDTPYWLLFALLIRFMGIKYWKTEYLNNLKQS